MENIHTYKSISEYDKNNNLIKYAEFTDDFEFIKCYYSVNGDKIERSYLQDYRNDENPGIEILNSIIQYDNNVKLFSLTLDGETYIQPTVSGITTFQAPSIVNCFYSCQSEGDHNASVESFSVKSNLIEDYLNKL